MSTNARTLDQITEIAERLTQERLEDAYQALDEIDQLASDGMDSPPWAGVALNRIRRRIHDYFAGSAPDRAQEELAL